MNVVFSPQAWEDYQHWRSADRTILKRINRLINEVRRDPYEEYVLAESWSRRVTDEHRLVYRIGGENVEIYQARYHY